jgi:hypothetical protein
MGMELTLAPEMRPAASLALLAFAGTLSLSPAELQAVVAQELYCCESGRGEPGDLDNLP